MTLCAEHVEHMLWCQSLAMPCLVEQLADLRFFIEMLGAVLAWATIQHSPSPLPTKFKYFYRYRYIHIYKYNQTLQQNPTIYDA